MNAAGQFTTADHHTKVLTINAAGFIALMLFAGSFF
jgi:hypothetical protein